MTTLAAPLQERIDYAATLSSRTKGFILAGVLLGLFLEALDQTIVATALPAVVRQFQGIDLLAWVSTGYLLASTALVPVYGKLSDIIGRRIIVVWSISVFLLGSVLCGLSGSMLQLVIFRFVQGIGAAGLGSTAFAIPADLYPPAERARPSGLIGAVFGIASIIGPFIGGFLTDAFSWRWVFYVNIPFGVLALALILSKMPKLDSGQREPIDWLGTILLLATVVPLLLGLSLDKTHFPWSSPLIIGLFVVSAVALVLLLLVERRAVAPIIALQLFRNRSFAVVILLALLNGFAFLPTILFLPLFLVNVVGVSATAAGTSLIPQTLAVVVAAVGGSVIVQRTGRYKPILLFGLALAIAGFTLLALMPVDVTRWGVTWRIMLLGFGLGCVVPLLSLIAQNALDHRYAGSATANVQFFQQIGGVVGAVIFGAVVSALLSTQFSARVVPAVSQLPPAVQRTIDLSRLRNGSSAQAAAGSSGATQPVALATQITQAVASDWEHQRTLVIAALRDNDVAAQNELRGNPETPQQIKQLLGPTGTTGADRTQQLNQALQLIDVAKAQAVQAAQPQGQQVQTAVKQAFATSITSIYRYVIGLIAAALLVGFALPELPLRKSNTEEPAPA